jgi:hypothetical protein
MMKNAAQPDRVKGLERASLTATVWLVFDHGAQLRSKVQSGIYPNQPCCECLHLIKMNCLALWLDESANACNRSELQRGASCEDWKSALTQGNFCCNLWTYLLTHSKLVM